MIDAKGLDEEIRCAICRNQMKTDRGCDGNCQVDEKLCKEIIQILEKHLSSAQPVATDTNVGDTISQQAAIELAMKYCPDDDGTVQYDGDIRELLDELENLPPVQPEKETPKRVLWNGWKGMRDTRYKCPNCKKPVRNTDVYCHRCGQKLMFPNIDFTPYVEGQKQELIVRWDDEE